MALAGETIDEEERRVRAWFGGDDDRLQCDVSVPRREA